jgi:hypothetical protein
MFNIQSPTHPGAVHIKTDVQVTYDIQLGRSWGRWNDKEIMFTMELVTCPNSSKINGNSQNNWTSRIYLGVAPPFFLPLGHVLCLGPFGLRPGGT